MNNKNENENSSFMALRCAAQEGFAGIASGDFDVFQSDQDIHSFVRQLGQDVRAALVWPLIASNSCSK